MDERVNPAMRMRQHRAEAAVDRAMEVLLAQDPQVAQASPEQRADLRERLRREIVTWLPQVEAWEAGEE